VRFTSSRWSENKVCTKTLQTVSKKKKLPKIKLLHTNSAKITISIKIIIIGMKLEVYVGEKTTEKVKY
jgi:hypothetical protein